MDGKQKVISGMRVKPLDFVKAADGRGFIAINAIGQFAVFDEGVPRWAFAGSWDSGYRYFYTETFEQAKQAANDFLIRSIVSLLEDQPQ